jgi:ABC-2 type transport system permease protein
MRGSVAAFLAMAQIAFSHELRQRSGLAARLCLMAVFFIIFGRLWQSAFTSGLQFQGSSADLLWYLAVGEIVVLSVPQLHVRIEDSVRDGSLEYRFLRPLRVEAALFAESIGAISARYLVTAIGTVLLALFFTSRWPAVGIGRVVAGIMVGLFAAWTLGLALLCIGMSACWLHESRPLFWLWQKFLFLFGGLILPLTLYPLWVQKVAWYTPFAPLINGPARVVLPGNEGGLLSTVVLLFLWSAVLWIFLRAICARAAWALGEKG